MKFTSAFAIVFACLVASSVFYEVAEAKKKKLIGALLLGAALAAKPKMLPLPLPIPIPIVKQEHKPVPYSKPYPVYINSYGGGYGGGHYGGGYGGGHYDGGYSGGGYSSGHYDSGYGGY